jgi:hypothetical protein
MYLTNVRDRRADDEHVITRAMIHTGACVIEGLCGNLTWAECKAVAKAVFRRMRAEQRAYHLQDLPACHTGLQTEVENTQSLLRCRDISA